MADQRLDDAVALWLGCRTSPFPCHNEDALKRAFGEDCALMLRQVSRILQEVDRIVVDWKVYSLADSGLFVEDQLRAKYPELTPQTISALAWYFMYNWK